MRLTSVLLAAATTLGAGAAPMLAGCAAEGTMVIEEEPPAPREEVVVTRPGFVYVHGHWNREGRRWAWVGGRYEILFQPAADPVGDKAGTKGAHILRWEKDRALAVEWRGRADMPEMNTSPLPTWVELKFEAAPDKPGHTLVSLAHYGFKEGAGWERSYDFFVNAWGTVLARLTEVCAGPR